MNTVKWSAIGIGTKNQEGNWLEIFYPKDLINLDSNIIEEASKFSADDFETPLDLSKEIVKELSTINLKDYLSDSSHLVMIVLREDKKIESVPEAYLKLHLLSYREVKPNSINLDNIFAMLPTVAWTSEGPKDPDELPEIIKDRKISGSQIHVYSLDKFPNLTDYVIPEGVRIADSSRVRLGAYVGEGTTIMHEGQINFNAGTLGKGMVEGRIAQGVIVDEGSDIGGGASTLGTLSGGNDLVISVGKDCLLGANSGLGISLGDRCIIESGLYLTSASKVEIIDDNNQVLKTVKAEELSLKPDLLFIRNSLTGSIQCKERKKDVNLNEDLHSNN